MKDTLELWKHDSEAEGCWQEMSMDRIEELEKYLEDECYSFDEISIGKHHAYEGIIIEKTGEGYCFGCMERGRKRIIKTFSTEKDLVQFAYQELSSDEWLKGHLVAWVWTEADIKLAETELKKMHILFKRNDIPNYREGQHAYRIFVFGKDVRRLSTFKKKYLKI